jgi:hypothetical protein
MITSSVGSVTWLGGTIVANDQAKQNEDGQGLRAVTNLAVQQCLLQFGRTSVGDLGVDAEKQSKTTSLCVKSLQVVFVSHSFNQGNPD